MIFGYTRPLYDDKDCVIQLNKLQTHCDTIFHETHGASKKRTQLEDMLMTLQFGDTIIVERMFVLADTSRHLVELLNICEKDGVIIHFLQEGIRSSELLPFSLHEMMIHLLQFQSDIVKQSTTIGIAQAKEQGKTIGRPRIPDTNIQKAILMYNSGKFTLLDIKNETGISKSTLYRYLETTENK